MKKVICFGDSNTYGFIPQSGQRYDENFRWSALLKRMFNNRYEVIEAGCNDRTCFSINPKGDEYTGFKAINKYILTDTAFFIIALGINDLQFCYNPSLIQIEEGIRKLVKIVKDQTPDITIILVSPSVITEDILKGYFKIQFDEISIEKSRFISEIYKKVAKEENCLFIDFNKFAKVSKSDGLHYDEDQHKIIASQMYNFILNSDK